MNFSRILKFVFIAFLGLCISFQADAQEQEEKKSKKKKNKDKTEVSNDDEKSISYLSLADLLRRKAGVSVQGSGSNTKVTIRGGSGAAGTDPLYVLDRVPIGNSYSQAAGMVDVNDIANIDVLKGADAAQYGTRGMSGVIVITTKKN
jgi:TonB-dependent SusC/RagA subfamily outer membrane receptor